MQSSTTWYGSQPWEKNEDVTSIDWGTAGHTQNSVDMSAASNNAYQSEASVEPPPSYEQAMDPTATTAGAGLAATNTAPAAFNATPQQQPQVCFRISYVATI